MENIKNMTAKMDVTTKDLETKFTHIPNEKYSISILIIVAVAMAIHTIK